MQAASSSKPHKGGVASNPENTSRTPSQQGSPAASAPVLATEARQPPRQNAGEQGGSGPHWAEWALVFVTGLLAVYTYRLWRSTKEAATEQAKLTVASLEEMRRAADAAGRSADVARDTLHLAHRAHLHLESWQIDNFRPNAVPIVQLDVLNTGPTGATLIGIRTAYDYTDPPPASPAYRAPAQPKHGLVRPSDMAEIVLSFEFQGPISEDAAEAVASGTRPIYIWGEITYEDIFGDDHRTGFGIELRVTGDETRMWTSRPIDKPGYNYAD
jgi:hypothetical protein